MQALIMWRYFWIGFIDFMVKGKRLLNSTNLFSPNNYEKKINNNNTKIFQITKKTKNYIALFAVSIENLENLKYQTS